MAEKEFLTGVSSPLIRVDRSDKDLTIEGWSEPRVLVECETDPKVVSFEQGLAVTAEEDLVIRVPFTAKVEVVLARADLVVRDLKSTVVIRECAGDLILRHCDSADLGVIRGNLKARDIGGDLKAQTVSGDVKLRHVLGAVELEAGGDVRVEHPVSQARIRTGGDASIAVLPKPGTENRIYAKGDLRCYLPAGVSVVVDGKAGGDTFMRYPDAEKAVQAPTKNGNFPATLGKGEARLALEADGDLWLGGWMDVDSWGEWRELGRDMGQLGMEFGMLAGEFGRWFEHNMHEKFDEYDKRLRLKMDEAKKLGRDRRWSTWDVTPPRAPTPPTPHGAGEKERLSILDILQKGKISVDEAERLLSAVEKTG
jgi:hypothetical protein